MSKTTKRCLGCDVELGINEFSLRDFDSESEEFVYSDYCSDCVADLEEVEEDEVLDDVEVDVIAQIEERYAHALAGIAQLDLKLISSYRESDFYQKIGIDDRAGVKFRRVQDLAVEIASAMTGCDYARDIVHGPGNYIVIGDSHGVYEDQLAIGAVRRFAEYLDAKVIHVGHLLDKHKNMSKALFEIPNLTIIPMAEEIPLVSKRHAELPSFAIARDRVIIGDVVVRNQNYRGEYTIGSSKGLKFEESGCGTIVLSRHLHEVHTHTRNGTSCLVMTPGCMCERHQARPPRKKIITKRDDLETMALSATAAGRRQKETNAYWENGLVVIHAMSDGTSTCIPLRIKKADGKPTLVYGRQVFTDEGVSEVDELGIVVGDMHVAKHDPKAIDIVDQMAKKLSPDFHINLGDHVNASSLNHHKMDRNEPIVDADIVSEFGKAYRMLVETGKWAPEKYIIIGNHGRFIEDFYKKYPQLESLLNYHILSGAEKAGFEVSECRGVLERSGAKYIHGDMRIYGATGDKHDQIRSTMETDTMVGHVHQPSVRRGVYFVGLLGEMDQGYNEPEASNWMHGFGVVAHYRGEVFMTSIGFSNYKMSFDGDMLRTRSNLSRWTPPDYEAEIVYREKRDA